MPDASIYPYISTSIQLSDPVPVMSKPITTKKSIGICLPRTLRHPNYLNEYNKIIKSLSRICKKILRTEKDCTLYFIPFSTNKSNPNENDLLLAEDILNAINCDKCQKQIVLLDHVNLDFFKTLNYTICGRYHSILFSIYYGIPFFPLFTTRKIKNFLLEHKWTYGYEFDTNWKDVPVSIDETVLFSRLHSFLNEPIHFLQKKVIQIFETLRQDSVNLTLNLNSISPYHKLWQIVLRLAKEGNTPSKIAKVIMYSLIGMAHSKYNWGLEQKLNKIDSFDYQKEFDFIVHDSKNWKYTIPHNPNGLFKLTFIDQTDYHQVHRSGWDYTIKNLISYNNNNSDILLDTYLDRTFHWDREYLQVLGILPYRKPWVGVIHHTFNTTFSEYNSDRLFKDPLFIESLKSCRGLIVLSADMKCKIQSLGVTPLPPVINLIHPTLFDYSIPLFDFRKFRKNKCKKILSIGGWMRDIYSFYRLDLNTFVHCNCSFKKCAIKGKFMNNYFPSNNFLQTLFNSTLTNCDTSKSDLVCFSGIITNADTIQTPSFNAQFYNQIENEIKSVTLFSTLSNEDYDNLLTNNIVYIKLIDAAAVNTLIECAVRTTPIIINRLPAVVEILGEDYPLYLESGNITCKKIKDAHLYLKKIHKDILYKTNIETFLKSFINFMRERLSS
jgi:hypothetical protein